jgi:hypothetical protein
MKFLALLSTVFALVTTAHAQESASATAAAFTQLPLVSISTEAYPDQTYTMGFDLDANRQAVGLYYNDPYQDDANKRLLDFSFATLRATPQLLIKRSGYDVVKLSYANNKLNILYKKDARRDEWSTKVFNVSCDAQNNNCSVIDGDTGRNTNSIYISSHRARVFFINTVVGIESIESR